MTTMRTLQADESPSLAPSSAESDFGTASIEPSASPFPTDFGTVSMEPSASPFPTDFGTASMEPSASPFPTASIAPSASVAPTFADTMSETESIAPSASAFPTPSMAPSTSVAPTFADTISETASFIPTPAPVRTLAPVRGQVTPSTNNDAAKNFGWAVFAGVFLVATVFVWRFYACCRRRGDKRMMDQRSAQADRVLGDLQMLPREEMDLL